MGTLNLDDPSLFVVPGRDFSTAQGYLRVFKCPSYNSKSNFVSSDFEWVGDIDVLRLDPIYDGSGIMLTKQTTTHTDLYVTPCSCPIDGNDLVRLYNRLVKHFEIVNNAGQVMLALSKEHEVKEVDSNGAIVVVSQYVRCADVFLWSDFGAPKDPKLCKLYARFKLFTNVAVDNLQSELDACRARTSPSNPAGTSEHDDLKKQLKDVQAKLSDKERELKEEREKVKRLKDDLADCRKKGEAPSAVDWKSKYEKTYAELTAESQKNTRLNNELIDTAVERDKIQEQLSECEREKERFRRAVNDNAVLADKRLIAIREIKAQLITQLENTTRYGWGVSWFHSWVRGYVDRIDSINGSVS
uniref:p41 n=1 Tax=Peanut clump virus M TaxID=188885 RepID=Q8B0Y2_9VIRU|nr:P41 [Peanut clump virus M]